MPLLPAHPVAILALAVTVVGVAAMWRATVHKAYGFAMVILAVFALQMVSQLFLGGDLVAGWLAFRTQPFLAGEAWWAAWSYMFVHAGPMHLIGNLFILIIVGPTLETRIGARNFVIVYLLAGLFAAASHVAITYAGIVHPLSPAVGASGAIFGVLTAYAVLYPREEIPFPLFILIWLPAFAVLLIFLAMNLAYIFQSTGVAWWGHFAGFLVGLGAATRLERQEARRVGAVDVEDLRPLATSDELQEVLERLERIEGNTPDDATWAEAWLERFAQRARCPQCEGRLRYEAGALVCEAGDFEQAIRARPKEEQV